MWKIEHSPHSVCWTLLAQDLYFGLCAMLVLAVFHDGEFLIVES